MAENTTQSPQPGETISPASQVQPGSPSSVSPSPPIAAPSSSPDATLPPTPEPVAESAAPAALPVDPTPEAEGDESYVADEQSNPDDVISWTASEFIAHQKSSGWYVRLALVGVVATVLIWYITKAIIPAMAIAVCTFVLGYYASRQPRQLRYQLDDEGVMIGEKFVSYRAFRSFAIMQEGAFDSLVFLPLKRFSQLTAIYYAPELADHIVSFLSDHLPMEERHMDTIDRFMNRIRF